MMRRDVHQHMWSEGLVAALARRSEPPFVRRNGLVWELTVRGEAKCTIDVTGDEVATRGALVHLDGLDRAVLSLSTVLGVEGLPGDEAADVIDAYHGDLDALPELFDGWASLPLREATAAHVDWALDGKRAGICMPAGAIGTPAGIERVAPVLERVEELGAVLFVHPGPDPFGEQHAGMDVPTWFPAMTSYVAWMNAAWHSFIAVGRERFPQLRVLFAMLAGAAPLHSERLAARGGPANRVVDRNIYYDTSSYGVRAVDAMVRTVGIDQLVHGSDRPVVAPPAAPGPLGDAAWTAMTRWNPGRLLTRERPEVSVAA